MQQRTISAEQEADYVTIVAPTSDEVMQRYHDSGMAAQGYAIAGRLTQHSFAYAGRDARSEMFGGAPMMAATFFRSAQAR